jgi:hypothetical protein
MENIKTTNKNFQLILLSGYAILFVVLAVWVVTRVNPPFGNIDFFKLRNAAISILYGNSPYSFTPEGNLYSPASMILYFPFVFIESNVSLITWSALNLIAIGAAFFMLCKIYKIERFTPLMIFAAILFLSFEPIFDNLAWGNVNGIVFFCLVCFLFGSYFPKHGWACDILFVLAILLKLTPVLLLTIPLFSRDWKRLVRIFVIGFSFVFASVIIFGFTPWIDYFRFAIPWLLSGISFAGSFDLSISLTADWLIKLVIPSHALQSTPKQILTIPVLAIWFIVLFKRSYSASKSDLFNLGIISMILCASLIEYHHFVFLLAPFLAVAVNTERGSSTNLFYGFCFAMLLIQVDRLIEAMFIVPAIPAQIGFVMMYVLYLVKITD